MKTSPYLALSETMPGSTLCRAIQQQEARVACMAGAGVEVLSITAQTEWPQLREDILEVASPGPPAVKKEVCLRMQRVYSLFQP